MEAVLVEQFCSFLFLPSLQCQQMFMNYQVSFALLEDEEQFCFI